MNLFDYVAWRGDIEFNRLPFNPVDNIIFCQLSYLPMDGIVPGPGEKDGISIARAAARFVERQQLDPNIQEALMKDPIMSDAASLIVSMGNSPRYRSCSLSGYINHIDPVQQEQFSAFSAVLAKKVINQKSLIVFRGTDISLVGWKEDFNMSCNDFIPSQRDAAAYLETMAEHLRGPLIIAGHSKGGNLAIYAAAHCRVKTRRRVSVIYSNDAPGFTRQIIDSEGYQAIQQRIYAFVPQSSVVGMLFEHGETPAVVKSTASGAIQHNLCTWEVTPNDIVRAGELSRYSRLAEAIIRDWLNELEISQRRQFIDAVYKVLLATNAQSLADLSADWFKSATGIIKSLKGIDKPTRKLIRKVIGSFLRTARKNITEY